MTNETERAASFAKGLESDFGGGLISVILYGSAARGEFRPGSSDLNLLLITDRLGVQDLARMSGAVREWTEGGNPPPLLMTIQEWRTSADVFPIEYADIRDSHIRLSGADPFDGIRIGAEHLRLQLEHELRSRKIQLREGLLVAGDEPEAVAALLTASLATFLTFFRAALRLAGRTVPRESAALIQAASELAGFDPSSVLAVERARRDSSQRSDLVQPPVLSGYLAAIESTVAWLDGHAVPNGVEVR